MTASNTRFIDQVVADAQQHPGQWTILARQVPTSRGRAYAKRGCGVAYRNQHKPGIADILLCWPDRNGALGAEQSLRQA